MKRLTTVVVSGCLVASSASALADGFEYGTWRETHPVFFDSGMITRRFAPSPDQAAFRGTTPVNLEPSSAFTGDFRFGVEFSYHSFVAIEGEFGQTDLPDSNVAGAYLVLGVRGATRFGVISAELAGGTRSVRYSLASADVSKAILEPRVRAEGWLCSWLTLGAALGAPVGDRQGWMAGVYLGVHSMPFDGTR